MNRIVLIGNGFDLAKGLKSSYKDFIDWFWKRMISGFNTRDANPFENKFIRIDIPKEFEERIPAYDYELFNKQLEQAKIDIIFKNNFLKIISKKRLDNWVDIEEEYFQAVKNILMDSTKLKNDNDIHKLNSEFDEIKIQLKEYLLEEQEKFKFEKADFGNLSASFNLFDFTSNGVERFQENHLSINDNQEYIEEFKKKKDNLKRDAYDSCDTYIYPESTLFLNFNYTDVLTKSIRFITENRWRFDKWAESRMEVIRIHGELPSRSENPIIFGYGDESDELQTELEKRGGEYLTNIKTINYLKTKRYKKVLSFLDSGIYQVFIMGHSCGLSDKTLLKTIFEHENCISIKPFYYTFDGSNDYDDRVKNIYRIFSNKAQMRDKVVNFEFCSEMKV